MKTKTVAYFSGCIIGVGLMCKTVAYAGDMSQMEWGIDRPGSDYKSFVTVQRNPQLCQDQCAVEEQCVAWTFDLNASRCWLKNAPPDAKLQNVTVSGVKTRP